MNRIIAVCVFALSSLFFGAAGQAATYVYVSNAEDGDIGTYTLQPDGSLKPGPRYPAGKMVMPMSVSPDKRFLVAAVRTKPFSAHTYGIDRTSGALTPVGAGPLAESFPYIFHDRTGRHLTPNGRFLYAAERTSSSIAAFSVDAATGKLAYLGSTPTEKQPRGFRIDPTGRVMVVSGELSDMLATYAIDAGGALKPIGRYPTGKGSNWVEIVSFD